MTALAASTSSLPIGLYRGKAASMVFGPPNSASGADFSTVVLIVAPSVQSSVDTAFGSGFQRDPRRLRNGERGNAVFAAADGAATRVHCLDDVFDQSQGDVAKAPLLRRLGPQHLIPGIVDARRDCGPLHLHTGVGDAQAAARADDIHLEHGEIRGIEPGEEAAGALVEAHAYVTCRIRRRRAG